MKVLRIAMLVALPAILAAVAAGMNIGKVDMDVLAAQLERNAADWLADKEIQNPADDKLRGLSYSNESIPLLAAELGKPRKDPLNLYVGNKLISPLLMGKAEVIQKALPVVTQFHSSAGKVMDMPRYTPAELKTFGPLESPARATSTSQPAALTKAQEQKVARERPIALHNQQLYQLDVARAKLLLYADTLQADRQLLDMLREALGNHSWLYVDIVAAIREEAGRLSEARAKLYHLAVLQAANELRLHKALYTQPGRMSVSLTGNSTLPEQLDYPGIRLYEAANILATAARVPAVKVPTAQEVDASGKSAGAASKAIGTPDPQEREAP